jgi:3-methyladenine DNA glycosylase AlkD
MLKKNEVLQLLKSKIHEERLVAVLILVSWFEKGDENTKEDIYKLYLDNTEYINNWDLVDLSASKIVGAFLFD